MKYTIIILLLISVCGCARPEKDPHLKDYIYQEFKNELSIAETKLADKTKELDEFTGKLAAKNQTDVEMKSLRIKADNATKQIRRIDQQIRYWKLKLLSREALVREKYLEAFNKGELWNNEEEVLRYQKAVARLRSQRSRQAASAEAPKAKPPAAEAEE